MKSVVRALLCFGCLVASVHHGPAQVVISEFMADNKHTLAEENGQFPDWVELYNITASTVNLWGWSLTDDPSLQERWFFPATNLDAKGFIVVFASGLNRTNAGAPLHTDFSLKASGEYLALVRPDGTIATQFAPTFPPQEPDVSYGLAQDVTTNVLLAPGANARFWVPASGALGSTWTQKGFTDSSWLSGPTGLGYETAVEGFAVYNYLANVSVNSLAVAEGVLQNPSQQLAVYSENAPVLNYLNTGGSGNYDNDSTFPGLTLGVDQNNFVLEATATLTIPAAGDWTFGVNSDDGFSLTIGAFNMSFPNPRGPGDTLQTFNFPAAGNYALDLVFYENGGGSEVELYAAQGSYASWDSTNFRLVGDLANGGLPVTAPVVAGGSGATSYRSFIATDLQAQMYRTNASVYVRLPFNVSNPASLESLSLRMNYDDGFVAYLNGQFVTSRNAPATPVWSSAATAAHPNSQAVVVQELNLSGSLNALQTGTNVLALQGLNQSAGDTDFLLVPALVEYRATALTNRFFATPSPGALNNSGFIAFVADTKFSVDRGFFASPFSLSITSATAGATIIYTTNGSTPSLSNGFVYSAPLAISGTKVVRAAAFKDGFLPSNVDTETYLFTNDIIRQSPAGLPPPGWPATWGPNVVDYGMDPDVVSNPAYSGEIAGDLESIPSYSIVTDLPNLFDATTGIYANAANDGIDWERPASIELLYADGTPGFHINGGIRIRGGFSRSPDNPKHAFRLFFRQEYGAAKLEYPVFANQAGAATFDSFDLRTFQNYSWSFLGDYRFIGLRDQFSRDTQIAQGQPAERGDFYHLYINGQYWGLFNTCERPEASYGESYLGGRKEDYDVIKVDTGGSYSIYATDGNMDAWTRLWRAATNGFASDTDYFRVQGLFPDGTPNPAYENLLDVDNLIDYMLVIFFTGNIDAPISAFISNANPNNMYALRNRTGLYGGFRFLAHDSEHTLLHESSLGDNDELHRDRTGPFPAGDPLQQGVAAAFAHSNPQYLFTRLADNAEFRLRVADHVQDQFFNGGALTTEACRARFLTRSNEIYRAVVAESARWGDSKRTTPLTRNVEWVTEMNRVYGDYFAQRPGIALGQLQAKGWFPAITAPSFNQLGGNVTNGFTLLMTAPLGAIYYTRDGSDPRLRGGAVAPTAQAYTGPVTLSQSARVKARVLYSGAWSALTDATFYVIQNFTGLLLTEIMYHPPGATNFDGDQFEFLELKNVATTNLELSGVHFTDGVSYTFPVGTFIGPGQFVVLVSDRAAFTNRYPNVRVAGVYTGKLSNSGERLTLAHVTGSVIFTTDYATRAPWPSSPDGTGFSLVPVYANFNPDPANPVNWRASSMIGGSPGADDLAPALPRILVNEALTHTDLPELDSIELYNPNPTNVNIGGWYLTDQRTVPLKFRIPADTIILSNGFKVFTEDDWNADPAGSNSFRLDSHGEEIYLYSADTNGTLTGYSDGFAFGAAQNGVTFGRYVISTGEAQYPAQSINTLGGPNALPRVGPLVLNEIHYHPPAGGDEFVELKSITNGTLRLFDPLYPTNTWRLTGVGFDFPTNTTVAPNGLLLVVQTDPAAFRAKYNVPAEVPVFGPYPGTLRGGGETLALQCPDHPDFDTNTGTFFIPMIDVDVVHYDDKAPWPTNADGLGPSLERLSATAYGNDPINWRASPGGPSPGLENTGNRLPVVNAGPDQVISASNAPIVVTLPGAAVDDGLPDPPSGLSLLWTQVSGPGQAWFADPAQSNSPAYFPGLGQYVLRLTASDGALQSSDDLTVTIVHPTSSVPTTLVSKGSVWKYLDDGSDQGTAWRSPTFSDGGWKSGPAPLGYSDANGQWPATTNSYGPDPNNKYITTYYRRSFTVTNAASVTNLVVRVQRDDGVVVYLNGAGIFTNNLPSSVPIGYLTNALVAVGGVDETTFYSQSVSPLLLVSGTNVLAAEIHQANRTSSDIIFDLELSGARLPANQAPAVNAGPGQTITLPAAANLAGTVADDGLPIPPGWLTFNWSKISGPGTVTFGDAGALNTTAAFSTDGIYGLRLTVSDGSAGSHADVQVTVEPESQSPLRIEWVEVSTSSPQQLRLAFTELAGHTYRVQFRDSLSGGAWTTLSNLPAPASTQLLVVTDPIAPGSVQRYYRIVTP